MPKPPVEVPAEPRVPAKPDIAPVVPAKPVEPKPDGTPDVKPDAVKPDAVKPDAPKPVPPKKDDPFGNARNDAKGLRIWTDSSGNYQVEARFVSFQDGTVRLQRANGRFVRIDYWLLSSADQSLVLRQARSLFAQE
jgi:hypothetical protein